MNSSAAVPTRSERPRTWRRRLRFYGLSLAGGYVVLLVLLVLLEDRFVYPGDPASASWFPPGLWVEDVGLHSGDGTPIHAWWCPRRGGRGALLYCHGNAGNLSHRAGLIPRLQALGAPVLIFDYPGYGRSGGKPSEAGCYAAADAAYDWLVQTKKIPPEEVLLVGKSLGGGVATDLAVRRPHRALVLCMTFTDLPSVAARHLPFFPARWLMRNRFDNVGKLAGHRGPVFLAHGTADTMIPAAESERLFAAAAGPKRYFAMEGVAHGWPFFSDECLDAIRAFLREVEAPSRPRPRD